LLAQEVAYVTEPKYFSDYISNVTTALRVLAASTFELVSCCSARGLFALLCYLSTPCVIFYDYYYSCSFMERSLVPCLPDIVDGNVNNVMKLLQYLRDKFDLEFLFNKVMGEELDDEEMYSIESDTMDWQNTPREAVVSPPLSPSAHKSALPSNLHQPSTHAAGQQSHQAQRQPTSITKTVEVNLRPVASEKPAQPSLADRLSPWKDNVASAEPPGSLQRHKTFAQQDQIKPDRDLRSARSRDSADQSQAKPERDLRSARSRDGADQSQAKPERDLRSASSRDGADQSQAKPEHDLRSAKSRDGADQSQAKPECDLRSARSRDAAEQSQAKPESDLESARSRDGADQSQQSRDSRPPVAPPVTGAGAENSNNKTAVSNQADAKTTGPDEASKQGGKRTRPKSHLEKKEKKEKLKDAPRKSLSDRELLKQQRTEKKTKKERHEEKNEHKRKEKERKKEDKERKKKEKEKKKKKEAKEKKESGTVKDIKGKHKKGGSFPFPVLLATTSSYSPSLC